ncbi:redoxin domain-containing protein [Nitratireductor sp. CAU 1489]|uniref:thioredoxin-dependent peroxiredoxin n=1 Tax=Nitratireductor arenosus TaxID=2682096 RepID=A0A844QH09_9HYPH|nr:peroxiredoxin [Nitratireductor arenosus]MVA97303.1 redoxin domain-containing protein [Nitratireductor arenosus]
MAQPEIGQQAPDFDLPRDSGGSLRLSDLRGKPVIVYFYPKDDTSGCTTEGKDFSTLLPEFEKAGATVIGISPDSAKSHDKFKAKHGLSIILVADEDKSAIGDYGVWVEKSMYGRKFMGVERTTILIDRDGRVARVWNKVKVANHAAAVLEATRAL